MRVWPVLDTPATIHPWSLESCGLHLLSVGQGLVSISGAAWPANNRIIYVPFWLQKPAQPRGFFFMPWGPGLGSYDVGVLSKDGVRLARTGVTELPSPNPGPDQPPQYVPVAIPLLGVGLHYIALWGVATTLSVWGRNQSSVSVASWMGLLQQAGGAGGIPAQATFARLSSALVPMVGIVFDDRVFV